MSHYSWCLTLDGNAGAHRITIRLAGKGDLSHVLVVSRRLVVRLTMNYLKMIVCALLVDSNVIVRHGCRKIPTLHSRLIGQRGSLEVCWRVHLKFGFCVDVK